MRASRDSVVALGFPLSNRPNLPKSRSLIVLVVGTDLACLDRVSDGLLSLPPGKWSSTRCEIKAENALQSTCNIIWVTSSQRV